MFGLVAAVAGYDVAAAADFGSAVDEIVGVGFEVVADAGIGAGAAGADDIAAVALGVGVVDRFGCELGGLLVA